MMVKGDEPARLYRSRVPYGDVPDHAASEQIGEGSFAKMLRVALSDPDDEGWRYSIRTGHIVCEGDDLRRCKSV